jgi:Rod binding domain-containing protein
VIPLVLQAPVLLDGNSGAGNSTTTLSPKLVSAAHEFEASMMKELMAPLQSGDALTGGNGDDEGSSSALGSFAGEALGKAISEHGGFGIATSILHQFATRNHSGNRNQPRSPYGNTPNVPVK